MYSNFITPPDFVDDQKHTVTVINASEDDVALLAHLCKNANETYNVYLYRTEMNDSTWLDSAVERSDAIVLNSELNEHLDLCTKEHVYYYGPQTFVSPSQKVNDVLEYFVLRNKS